MHQASYSQKLDCRAHLQYYSSSSIFMYKINMVTYHSFVREYQSYYLANASHFLTTFYWQVVRELPVIIIQWRLQLRLSWRKNTLHWNAPLVA